MTEQQYNSFEVEGTSNEQLSQGFSIGSPRRYSTTVFRATLMPGADVDLQYLSDHQSSFQEVQPGAFATVEMHEQNVQSIAQLNAQLVKITQEFIALQAVVQTMTQSLASLQAQQPQKAATVTTGTQTKDPQRNQEDTNEGFGGKPTQQSKATDLATIGDFAQVLKAEDKVLLEAHADAGPEGKNELSKISLNDNNGIESIPYLKTEKQDSNEAKQAMGPAEDDKIPQFHAELDTKLPESNQLLLQGAPSQASQNLEEAKDSVFDEIERQAAASISQDLAKVPAIKKKVNKKPKVKVGIKQREEPPKEVSAPVEEQLLTKTTLSVTESKEQEKQASEASSQSKIVQNEKKFIAAVAELSDDDSDLELTQNSKQLNERKGQAEGDLVKLQSNNLPQYSALDPLSMATPLLVSTESIMITKKLQHVASVNLIERRNTSGFLEEEVKSENNPQLRTLMEYCNLLNVDREAFEHFITQSCTSISCPKDELQIVNRQLKQFLQQQTTSEQPDIKNINEQLTQQMIVMNVIVQKLLQDKKLQEEMIPMMNTLKEVVPLVFNRVSEISKETKVAQQKLHFAFLFANPLMMQQSNGLKEVVQLNYHKEYAKIKERLDACDKQIRFQKRQCTQNIISEVLKQRPIGLHFSGHGIRRKDIKVDELQLLKDEGDYLLIEEEGEAFLLSRDKLKQIIKDTQCQLEFVALLNCHSQDQGELFISVGAKHVICIDRQKTVQDAAAVVFTETFYKLIFQDGMRICDAFEQAREIVNGRFGEEEEKKFLLLVGDSKEKGKINIPNSKGYKGEEGAFSKHLCNSLPFSRLASGKCIDTFQNKSMLSQRAKKHEMIGREEVSYQLINKLLSPVNKILTIWGQGGLGRQAVVNQVLSYISERQLIKGGFVWVDASGIRDIFKFVFKLQFDLLQQNEQFFGTSKDELLSQLNKDYNACLSSTFKRLNMLGETVIFVFKNCEGLIQQQREEFSKILTRLTNELDACKLILLTTQRLENTNEDLILLKPLTKKHAVNLFLKAANRTIQVYEEHDLWNYTEKQCRTNKKQVLEEHKLMEFLGGSPQAILLIAPLLSDPQRNLKLLDVYKLIEKQEISSQFTQQSLSISIGLAYRQIEESEDALFLLFLISMFPGRIRHNELDVLWRSLQKHRKQTNEDWKPLLNQLVDAKLLQAQEKSDKAQVDTVKIPYSIRNFAQHQLVDKHEPKLKMLLHIQKWYIFEKVLSFYRTIERQGKKFDRKEFITDYVHNDVYGVQHYMAHLEIINSNKPVQTADINLDYLNFGNLKLKSDIDVIEQSSSSEGQASPRSQDESLKIKKQLLKRSKTDVVERQMMFTIQNNPEYKRTSIKVAKVAAGFIKKLKLSKSHRLWHWAYEKIKKMNNMKKRHQNGDIVDMNAISFSTVLETLANTKAQTECGKEHFVTILGALQKKFKREIELETEKIAKEIAGQQLINQTTEDKIQANRKSLGAQPVKMGMNQKRLERSKNESDHQCQEDHDCMTIDEMVIILHNMNLLLADESKIALRWIENHLETFDEKSKLFQANLKRLHALCLFSNFEKDINQTAETGSFIDSTPHLITLNRVLHLLKESQQKFKVLNGVWGEALVLFQLATVYEAAIKHNLLANVAPQFKFEVPSPERVSHEMKECLLASLVRFKEIDHYLGTASAANALAEFINDQQQYWFTEETSILTEEENSVSNRYEETHKEAKREWDCAKRNYPERDICIERNSGDRFSLLTEVVKFCSNQSLFQPKPQKLPK